MSTETINKSDIIEHLAQTEDMPYKAAKAVVDVFFDEIVEAMLQERRVELRGFGSFKVKQYESYRGRNPKTGEFIAVPAKRLPTFKAGKELIERLNNGNPQRNSEDG